MSRVLQFRHTIMLSLGAIALCGVCFGGYRAVKPPVTSAAVSEDVATAARAGQAFLASLTPEQRGSVNLPLDSPLKSHWHNLPPTMAPRPGLPFNTLTPEQQQLGQALLKAVLSDYGYTKISSIVAADKFLGEHNKMGFATGPNAYLLAVFGTPSSTQAWAIEYGGHHLGLNVAISGRNQQMSPTLTGAYPNTYMENGKEVFVLHDESDRALKLAASLTPEQRATGFSKTQIWNFVLGPAHDNERVAPEGIKGSALTVAQKSMLLDVVASWVNVMNNDSSKRKMDEVRRTINDTYFLFSGSDSARGMAYFRVSGPATWIEYSPQLIGGPGSAPNPNAPPPAWMRGGGNGPGGARNGGGAPPPNVWPPRDIDVEALAKSQPDPQLDANHVHAVYRDFNNEYGKTFSAR